MPTLNPNIPSAQIRQSVDFKLEALELYAPGFNGVYDLRQHMVELNYYEDIFNNTVSGNIVISDAVGLLNALSINGTEYLRMRFKKADNLPNATDRLFRVFGVSDRRFDPSNNNEIFVLEFCSDEFILSEQYRVSKSYTQTSISDIVQDICTTFLNIGTTPNSKKLIIDPTVGTYDFVLPNKKPIETINWLATYALPINKTGADMLFFENKFGYWFTSLQDLYKTETVLTFRYNPKNVAGKDIYQDMTNVLAFEVLNYVDTLKSMNAGTFANRLISIDPVRRKKSVTDFNYNDYFQQSYTLNGSPVTNNFKNQFGKMLFEPPPNDRDAGVLRMKVSNSQQQYSGSFTKNKPGTVQQDFYVENYLVNRVAQLSLATYTKLKLTVPGNPAIYAGMPIVFQIDAVQPITGQNKIRGTDPFLAGKYIVSAVRHIISPASYICVMEVCKESGIVNYSGFDDGDSKWNALTNNGQNNRLT